MCQSKREGGIRCDQENLSRIQAIDSKILQEYKNHLEENGVDLSKRKSASRDAQRDYIESKILKNPIRNKLFYRWRTAEHKALKETEESKKDDGLKKAQKIKREMDALDKKLAQNYREEARLVAGYGEKGKFEDFVESHESLSKKKKDAYLKASLMNSSDQSNALNVNSRGESNMVTLSAHYTHYNRTKQIFDEGGDYLEGKNKFYANGSSLVIVRGVPTSKNEFQMDTPEAKKIFSTYLEKEKVLIEREFEDYRG